MSENIRAVKYDVCFVQSSNSLDDAPDNLKLAFEHMDVNDLQPTWVSKDDCLKIHEKESKLFVMDPLEGETFEHLVKLRCRVVGPLCIISCLQLNDNLPKRPHPVYSVSMRRMSVSCSNVDKACREDLRKKIELMCGTFSKDLTKSVSHLIVGEVGSKKYHVAANFGLPIMLPEWVENVWENQSKQLHASDTYFDKFKCPIFYGLVICVSQLSPEERAALKSVIENNGGKYSGALKARETTHLVLSDPTGEKYRFARSWKVFCIKVNWIYDSIKYGYCRDENLYPLDSCNPPPKRSTPQKNKASELPNIDCSVISSNSLISHLDETTRTEVFAPAVTKRNSALHALEAFNVSSLPKSGQFLDGCKIFLTGFSNAQMDKLRKIVNVGGGMRFSKYSDSISHVVCEELSDELLESIRLSSVKPHVVNFNWLLECCKNEKMVDENPFLCIELDGLSPQKSKPCATLSNSSMNETTKNKFPLSSQTDDMNQDNITDIFRQYIDENKSECVVDNISLPNLAEQANDDQIEIKNNSKITVSCDKDEYDEIFVESEVSSQQLFKGKTLIISGFGEKDTEILSNMIEAHGGKVLPIDSECISDIAIVPLVWNDFSLKANKVVTNCWLQKCIEDNQIYNFDDNEVFRPVDIDLTLKPFENFVISVSQYSGTERDCLMHLAEVLGATCQEYFVRKANKSKGVLPNTHLVVCTPDGSKYEAARKWKIPAVTKYWLFHAAKSGMVPPVENYLVENFDEFSKNPKFFPENEPIPVAEDVCENDLNEHLKDELNNNSTINANVEKGKILQKKQTLNTSLKRVIEVSECRKPSPPQRGKLDVSLNKSLGKPSDLRFNVSGLLNDLDSCSSQESFSIGKKAESPSLAKLFNRNLSAAIENINALSQTADKKKLIEAGDKVMEKDSSSCVKNNVLKDVVVCVAKKLTNLQIEMNDIVTSLGGECSWSYNNKCTHYVFQGKLNDITKEFREARRQNKIIVSPEWVYACRDENARISEKLYPHTYRSRMSLSDQVSTSKISANDDVFASRKNNDDYVKLHPVSTVEDPKTDPVDFNKELNELLAAAKSEKRSLPKRLASSGSNSPVNDKVSSLRNGKFSNSHDNNFGKNLTEDMAEEADDHNAGSQPSQTYPITWDDLTGRLEREKIAARFAANKSEILAHEKETVVVPDDVISKIASPIKNKTRRFMFTGFSDSERAKFVASVKSLGGQVSEDKAFDSSATHLILEKPLKNEKFLASVASGKLVLHSSYVAASVENQHFLSEEMFEWGGVSTNQFMRDPSHNALKVANCPYRWRTKIEQDESMLGAFHGWKVVIYADDKQKYNTYANILKSGHAKIVPYPTPQCILNEVTHVFVESNKKPLQIELAPYISNNAKCLKPEYLAFYLIDDPPPPVDDFILPDAKDVSDPSSSFKKRNLHSASRGSKRSRLK